MKNHVEAFYGHDAMQLERDVNDYCIAHDYKPVSISVVFSAGTYVAFVVVEEGDKQ